jgi:ribosome-associated protein YbcJ (S4-like RNA binding protein)
MCVKVNCQTERRQNKKLRATTEEINVKDNSAMNGSTNTPTS